jgi:NTP pyrophosphatase (non-canonical NTP hydrolase)
VGEDSEGLVTVDEYQKWAWSNFKKGTFRDVITHCALGIGGESGEIIDPIKKYIEFGVGFNHAEMALEIGDALHYLVVLADRLGFTMTQIMEMNKAKLEARNKYLSENS